MALDMNAAFRISARVDGQQQLDRFNQSLKSAGQQGEVSAGQIKAAMRTLPAQFTDIATQLAGGQSPFLILLQQGGQIRDSFGSIGGAFRGITSLITPFSLAVGGAAAAVGTLAMAFIKGEAESVNFNRALAVTNNYAGQTADRFNAAAQRVQESANITAGAARELVQAVVASGQYGPTAIDAVASAMGNLQRVTGMATKDVQQQFAGLSKGAANWAADMNKTYNFLDVAQYRYIRRLEEAGNKEGAMREAAQMLDRALAQREQNLGTLERAWKKVTDAASGAWQAMLNIGREDTPGEKLAEVEERLKRLQAAQAGARSDNRARYQPAIDAARAEIENLQEVLKLQGRAADAAAARAKANQDAIAKEQEAEKDRERNAGRVSEFDRLKQQLDDQLLATRELGVAEKLVAEIQAGRYKELTKAQQETLIARAREVDYAVLLKEQEEAQAKRTEEITRKRDQAAESERRQNEAAKQRWVDLIDPTNKYIRQLEEIRALVSKGVLTPDQGFEAEFRVQEQISESLDKLKDKGKDTFKELKDAVEGWGRQATDTFIDFAFGAKASFSDLVSSILKDIARMMIQQNVTTPLFNAISGSAQSWIKDLFPFANGGVMTSDGPLPLRAYSNGGIANSPQLALYGEGRMPEAYVPLPDGRTIPVTMKGAGGGDVFNISIQVASDGSTQATGNQDGAALGKAIAAAVRAEMINQKRPGGLLAA